MKELDWNIRKMREEQKLSTTRNTYKLPKEMEYTPEETSHIAKHRESHFSKVNSFFVQLGASIMLILEEG